MIVLENSFKRNDNIIIYQIDERLTDGEIELRFKWISKVEYFSKRKASYKYEITQSEMVVKPTVIRKIDEYRKYIEEFFEENIFRVEKTNNILFECDLVDGKLACSEESRKKVDDLISKMNVNENTLISMLLNKSISGYK